MWWVSVSVYEFVYIAYKCNDLHLHSCVNVNDLHLHAIYMPYTTIYTYLHNIGLNNKILKAFSSTSKMYCFSIISHLLQFS
jgi:hypothetical protein